MPKGVSSRQKGNIVENRVAELITLGFYRRLACYAPVADDDGIDLLVRKKGRFRCLYVQVKNQFGLTNRRFVQSVGLNTFRSNADSIIVFALFDESRLDVEVVWIVPSSIFRRRTMKIAPGRNRRHATIRFSAGPASVKDRWNTFRVDKHDVGKHLRAWRDAGD